MGRFAYQYGPWAVVAGGSSGIGGAFAEELARRGCHLLLLAVDGDELDEIAPRLRAAHGIEVRTVEVDLARDDLLEVLHPHLDGLDIGLLVWNAALAPAGRFDRVDLAALDTAVDLNVRGPTRLVRELAPRLVTRGRGGIVLMSSLASLQGTGTLATYAATKAFNRVLAEGLWADLRPHGVDVVAVAPDRPTRRASVGAGPAAGRRPATRPRSHGPGSTGSATAPSSCRGGPTACRPRCSRACSPGAPPSPRSRE